ncbi:MAG: hypothetical protein ABI723_13975 [Bacteroidia bacterium]
MAQHYDITKYPQKYFRSIEDSFKRKFSLGVQKVKYSLKYFYVEDERAKEHSNDVVFETSKKVNNEIEKFEIHFDQNSNSITKIYLVK